MRRTLSTTELERYTGHFAVDADAFDVVLRDGALYLEIPDQPAFRMYASAPGELYLRVAAVTITYTCAGATCDTVALDQAGGTSLTPTRQ